MSISDVSKSCCFLHQPDFCLKARSFLIGLEVSVISLSNNIMLNHLPLKF